MSRTKNTEIPLSSPTFSMISVFFFAHKKIRKMRKIRKIEVQHYRILPRYILVHWPSPDHKNTPWTYPRAQAERNLCLLIYHSGKIPWNLLTKKSGKSGKTKSMRFHRISTSHPISLPVSVIETKPRRQWWIWMECSVRNHFCREWSVQYRRKWLLFCSI